jgi:MFS family permease
MAAGSIGDRFGRKGTLQVGMALFAVFSAFAAFAGTPGELIAWRAAMVIGGALIFPATLAILVNVFTLPRERAIAISVWAATSGLAVALGPVTGGLLLEHFWWGSVFMVNVPLILGAMVLIAVAVPTSRDETITRFDPLGTLLSIAGVAVLVWAVIEAPHNGWLSTTTLVAFGAAILLVAAGDNADRIRNEAAWAMLCGLAPIPVSSGKRDNRFRLNSGGNRQANHAHWRIVLTRLGQRDERTVAYMNRRLEQGLAKPSGTAAALLSLVERRPDVLQELAAI